MHDIWRKNTYQRDLLSTEINASSFNAIRLHPDGRDDPVSISHSPKNTHCVVSSDSPNHPPNDCRHTTPRVCSVSARILCGKYSCVVLWSTKQRRDNRPKENHTRPKTHNAGCNAFIEFAVVYRNADNDTVMPSYTIGICYKKRLPDIATLPDWESPPRNEFASKYPPALRRMKESVFEAVGADLDDFRFPKLPAIINIDVGSDSQCTFSQQHNRTNVVSIHFILGRHPTCTALWMFNEISYKRERPPLQTNNGRPGIHIYPRSLPHGEIWRPVHTHERPYVGDSRHRKVDRRPPGGPERKIPTHHIEHYYKQKIAQRFFHCAEHAKDISRVAIAPDLRDHHDHCAHHSRHPEMNPPYKKKQIHKCIA